MPRTKGSITPLTLPAPVYVDPLFCVISRDSKARNVGNRHGHQWCHMWSDNLEALELMARALGLKSVWLQTNPIPHYDLVPPRREKAIALGATQKTYREYLRERRAAEDEINDEIPGQSPPEPAVEFPPPAFAPVRRA